jgi:hypothetical protein
MTAAAGVNAMLVGYVSDEGYEALPGVTVEFRRDGRLVDVVESTPSGAVHADVEPGQHTVVLAKTGYGSKRSEVTLAEGTRHQFRLLSLEMLGYVWPKWCQAGETAEYRLHTPEDTRLSLWRYGYEKSELRVVDWHDEHGPRPGLQLLPDGDFTQTGVGWNDVGYEHDHSQEVEAPRESGLYYFHMRGKESGSFFSFPWVVAPAAPESSIAVIAGTNTWNAYNRFGGRSNYVNNTGLPETPVVHARSDLDRFQQPDTWAHENHEYEPLSFERPCRFNHVPTDRAVTDPIRGKEESHTAPAEWRFLGWLEREGYAYDLYADKQLHDGTLDLDAYDAVLVHTHPEYWSRGMYERLKSWVFDHGGHLGYLGGNGINAEVVFLNDGRMRVRNETTDLHESSLHVDATAGYESRFHRTVESEGTLLGVAYTASGIMTAAPYETLEPDHWIFEGTDLERGDLFGEETLQERVSGGASGHETDKLSRFAPEGTVRLAKGRNPGDGGAEMVYFETDSGGAVFSAGSITYTAGLLVDEVLTTVTRNVLDRFVG